MFQENKLVIADTLSRAHALQQINTHKNFICKEIETYVYSVFIPDIPFLEI